MFKGKSLFVIVLVMMMAVLLAACGGGDATPDTTTDDTTTDDGGGSTDGDGDAASADGDAVSFGVAAGQMFTATVPDGYSANEAGVLSNGEIAIAAAQAPLGGVSMEDFANATATALGDVETADANGRSVFYVTHAGGVTMWVSPDDTNVISITATQLTADPADAIDDLLVIAGSIESQ